MTVGIDSLPRTMELIQQGMEEGLHIGVQVYVSIKGESIADFAVGEARNGVPLTRDTLMLWLSSTKPAAAVAVAQLWERSRLTLDDPVSLHIPEFGVKGKEAITIRHLLTHTGGFRPVESLWRVASWEEILSHIYEEPIEPGWIPGRKAGYHIASSWYILGELVKRIDGREFSVYVREEIFEPLGMWDSWVGMPPEQYHSYGNRIAAMHDSEKSPPEPYDLWASEEILTVSRPGGNGYGPIRELGIFYEMLFRHGERHGAQILSPQTVEAMTTRHRVGMKDQTFRHVMDWGLGFIINSNIYGAETVPYGYGLHASPRTFGHSGNQSSTAFCDPEYNLVVTLVFNGMPGEVKHNKRIRAVNTAIYEDLGLGE